MLIRAIRQFSFGKFYYTANGVVSKITNDIEQIKEEGQFNHKKERLLN
jgi:hypothetical protein